MLDLAIEELKKAAMDFYAIANMKIVLYDEERRVLYSYPEKMCGLCEIVRKNPALAKKCIECDNIGLDNCTKSGKPYIYRCHMNLAEAVAPISENGIIIGYLMLGQVLIKSDSDKVRERILHISEKYGISADMLLSEMSSIRTASSAVVSSAVSMMSMCACYLYVNKIIRNRSNLLAYQLKDYIDSHLAEELTVSHICSRFFISKSKLYSLSQSIFGMGVSDYIRAARLDEAKKRLLNSSKPISQIADEVGFRDPNYFIRVFKAQEGISPGKYRLRSCYSDESSRKAD